MPQAILSTFDKTGLVEFARGLLALGWTLIASGGTAKWLKQHDLPVTEVSEITHSPEILGGRVKTLHPAIHGGLLARATQSDHEELLQLGWDYIDLAVVNPYPFEQTIAQPDVSLAEVIENIDIGGVTLIRAAAKNYERVTLVCDPSDYPAALDALKTGGTTLEMRKRLAVKGFALTARYDAAIAAYLSPESPLQLTVYPVQRLRYGENPHQNAMLYAYEPACRGPLGGKILQGKELSFTNLLDLDAAWRVVTNFERPTISIVRHVSPCGVASADTLAEAFQKALQSDPVSAYGGVVASNCPFDAGTVNAMGNLFVECIVAPHFTPEARELLARRKNCRLLEMPSSSIMPRFELRSIAYGLIKQDTDFGDPPGSPAWRVVTYRPPTPDEWVSLRFAWKVVPYVRTNAIVFARGEATVGVGGGQPNRVDAVRIAATRAGDRAAGACMASDAFFPFPDSIEHAAQVGVTAVIHPGGSVRDQESIDMANAHGMAMVLTGVRHFRH